MYPYNTIAIIRIHPYNRVMEYERLKKILADQLEEFRSNTASVSTQKKKKIALRRRQKVQRHFSEQDLQALAVPEITIITGVRRAGKSTYMTQYAETLKESSGIFFLNLEDPLLIGFTVSDFQKVWDIWLELDPDLYSYFFKEGKSKYKNIYVFFDEIQNIDGWERWVRGLAQKQSIKVIITGSNARMLSSELASVLTGRYRLIQLLPFSFSEAAEHILNLSKLSKIKKESSQISVGYNKVIGILLQKGGFPRSFIDEDTSILSLYFNDIVTRDIVKRRSVRNTIALIRLGEILCRENTRLFNRQKTGELLGIKDNVTFAKYCEYFKETYLFFELRKYSQSLRKQIRSSSKFYCVDPALPREVAGSSSNGYSAEFENLIFLELYRRYKEIYYWTSKNGKEVDFLLKNRDELTGVQAAYSVDKDETLAREISALEALHTDLKVKRLYIITRAENRILIRGGMVIKIVSIGKFCESMKV
jgi:uncharacterized protein